MSPPCCPDTNARARIRSTPGCRACSRRTPLRSQNQQLREELELAHGHVQELKLANRRRNATSTTRPTPSPRPRSMVPAGEFVRLSEPHTRGRPDRAASPIPGRVRRGHRPPRAPTHRGLTPLPKRVLRARGRLREGRKGSSWDDVETLLAAADHSFVASRLVSGLASGAGMIAETETRSTRPTPPRPPTSDCWCSSLSSPS